jgi:hypothetical protein
MPKPTTRAGAIAYFRRLASMHEAVVRRLRSVDPPPSYARLLRATLERARASSEALRDAAVTAERGGSGTALVERGYLLSVTAAFGYNRMGISRCAL